MQHVSKKRNDMPQLLRPLVKLKLLVVKLKPSALDSRLLLLLPMPISARPIRPTTLTEPAANLPNTVDRQLAVRCDC